MCVCACPGWMDQHARHARLQSSAYSFHAHAFVQRRVSQRVRGEKKTFVALHRRVGVEPLAYRRVIQSHRQACLQACVIARLTI